MKLGIQHQALKDYQVCSNDEPRLNFDLFIQESSLVPYLKRYLRWGIQDYWSSGLCVLFFHHGTFYVTSGPKQGSVMNQQMRVPVQAFNLKDLQTGQIIYQPHPRAKPGPDSVLLQATDNYSVLTMLLDIDIRTKVWQSEMVFDAECT